MDELLANLRETARATWHQRWIGVTTAWLTAVLGAVVLWALPDHYDASARVYVDTKTVLRPLMRDLAVEPELDHTVAMLARTLITRPNAELLMERAALLPENAPRATHARAVEALMRDIKISGSGRDGVFTFTYHDTTPDRALRLVQELVALFQASDRGAKQRDVEAARAFIDEQVKSYEARLAEAEQRLKDFKLRNLGITDYSGKDYFARMSALADERAKLMVELRAAEQSRDALERALSGEMISLAPELPQPGTGTPRSDIDTRLDAQRRQLDELLRRFTDLHPDVIATRRLIASLEAEQRQQAIVDEGKRTAGPQPSAQDRMQRQVRLALADAEGAVAALRVRVGDVEVRLGQARAAVSRVPQVEAELAQLNRDYDVVRRAYDNMVARREKASLSEEVDATRSAQFRVIDPPHTSLRPVFPNRPALAPLVIVIALVAGVGASAIAAQLRPTVGDARRLQQIAQRPVLGTVSRVMPPGRSALPRLAWGFAAASAGLFLAAGAWIGWLTQQAAA